MSWNLEGKRINGIYLGLWPYTGTVIESRVKYGGNVQHTVQVDEPFKVYGEVRETILVDEFNRILDERDADFARKVKLDNLDSTEFKGGFYDIGNMTLEDVRRAGRE